MTEPTRTQTVFPYLRYDAAHDAIEFLTDAFGFEVEALHELPDGNVAHAELSFGGDVIMVGSSRDDEKSPQNLEGVSGGLYLYVENVEAHLDRAEGAGATISEPLRETEYASREYAAVDLEGHHWSFGTYRPSAD